MEQCIISRSFIDKMSENLNSKNIKKIDKHYVHKENNDYVLISEIHEIPLEFLTDSALAKPKNHKFLYSIALPKYDCLFCFDHELDHMPFIMAIELVRQAGIAIAHSIYNVPVAGYTNIMDNITVNMETFIELDIPLIMIIEDVLVKTRKSRQERKLRFYLFQKENLCATLDINASVMEKDIYSRLRLTSRGGMIKDTGLCKAPTTNLQMLNTPYMNKVLMYND